MPDCTHLDTIGFTDAPNDAAGREGRLGSGGRQVHLRMCHRCGESGCCDSSASRLRRR